MRASEFLIEYKLKVSKDSDGVAIRATAGGKQLGHAEFFFDEQGRLDPQTVWVDERYHGQGIARDMYDHLKGLGYTIVRSWDQTDAGRGFWNKHRGEDARVWESSTQTRLPRSIEQFLYSLTPSDVGVEEIGPYRIHFEGFTDDCKSSSDYCADPDAVYQEVFDDFVQREGGGKPVASGMIGDEDYPVLYSVFLKQLDEGFSNDMSTEDMIAYLRQHHDTNLHRDYLDHVNTFSKFVLKDIPTNSISTELSGLDRAKVERYKKMGFNRMTPPIVVGSGYILDGYHRATAAKELGIPTIKAYVGIKDQQGVDENFADGKKPGRKGLAKRVGVNCKQSISKLRSIAAHSSGERQRMAHWCANMKSGKRK